MTDIIEAEAIEEHTEHLPVVKAHTAIVARDDITVAELVEQSQKIREAMRAVMVPGVHYGVIPGADKPTLYKPGAEVLNVLFRFAPEYDSEKIWHDDGHLTVVAKCRLRHIPTGFLIAEGEGLCTSREAKYAWRNAGRVCPECEADAIIKGKAEYGGGWLCFKKKGGCGAKFDDGTEQAQTFEKANPGRERNPDLEDSFNTVLKMAAKRAMLAAVLNGTAASDVFTQDVGDDDSDEERPTAKSHADVRTPPDPYAIDPGAQLLEGAPHGKHVVDEGMNMLFRVDPYVEWPKVVGAAIKECFGATRSKVPADRVSEMWHRYANACRRVDMDADPNGLPPLSDEQIQRVFAWAFDGAAVEVTRRPLNDPQKPREAPEAAESGAADADEGESAGKRRGAYDDD